MLVCHIAGCARVTGSATGIPTAGEAGCDTRCAALVARYLATVHRYLAAYAAPTPRRIDIRGLPAPAPFTGPRGGCTRPDPTSRGCLTPATRHALDQILAAFGPPGPDRADPLGHLLGPPPAEPAQRPPRRPRLRPVPHHRRAPSPPAPTSPHGWRIATWLRAHADALQIRYLIWQGRIWSPDHPDHNGWGRPYTGGGIYDPTDATGGHYDHVHLSITT